MKKLDEWDVKLTGTFVSIKPALAAKLVGAGSVDSTDTTKVVPRNDVDQGDFDTLWWIGDYSDKNGNTNGGFVAIKLINALSTGGFQLRSGDRAKGNFPFEFTGHYSMSAQDTVPFEIYIQAGSAEPTGATGVTGA